MVDQGNGFIVIFSANNDELLLSLFSTKKDIEFIFVFTSYYQIPFQLTFACSKSTMAATLENGVKYVHRYQ